MFYRASAVDSDTPLRGYLGPDASHRITKLCEEILWVMTQGSWIVKAAFNEYATLLQQQIDNHDVCSCPSKHRRRDYERPWDMSRSRCRTGLLCYSVKQLLQSSTASCFHRAGANSDGLCQERSCDNHHIYHRSIGGISQHSGLNRMSQMFNTALGMVSSDPSLRGTDLDLSSSGSLGKAFHLCLAASAGSIL